MLNYKLCKQLKDARFPQDKTRFSYVFPPKCREDYTNIMEVSKQQGRINLLSAGYEIVACPLLEELIDACGDKFEDLVRMVDIQDKKKVVWWQAYMTEKAFDKKVFDKIEDCCVRDCCGYETGDTPLEAMANLYIKLNEYKLEPGFKVLEKNGHVIKKVKLEEISLVKNKKY